MNLFQLGNFLLHSGDRGQFKINCDCLTNEDWNTLAYIIKESTIFSEVIGVPNGGLELASKLKKYRKKKANLVLIVDDVLTTGASMEIVRNKLMVPSRGIVVFARGQCPSWVVPIFQMDTYMNLQSCEGGEI